MHIPVCYPKIAQSITFFPHACFSNKRAARQFLEREEDFIMSYNQQRAQGNWFSFNLAKEAITVTYKARTFMIFKWPDLQRIPASDKEMQVCLLNHSSNNSYPAGCRAVSNLLLADLGAGKTGKLCCVIVLGRVKTKLTYSLSQRGLLAQVNVLTSSAGLIRLSARLAFTPGTSDY